MAWGSDTAATQLTSITTEQFFNQVPTLNPRETAHVQVSVDFPGSPTDHAIVAVYTTLDDSSEVWDLIPMMEFLIENTTDPNRISFLVTGVYKFRVGVRRSGSTDTITSADLSLRKDGVNANRHGDLILSGPSRRSGRSSPGPSIRVSAGSGTPSRASSCRCGSTRGRALRSATVSCATAGA